MRPSDCASAASALSGRRPQQRVETQQPQQPRERAQVGIREEARFTDRGRRGGRRRVRVDPPAPGEHGGERRRLAVQPHVADLGVRDVERFDRVLDRRAIGQGLFDHPAAVPAEGEILELAVEPDQHVRMRVAERPAGRCQRCGCVAYQSSHSRSRPRTTRCPRSGPRVSVTTVRWCSAGGRGGNR